jgi:hypothetical protein
LIERWSHLDIPDRLPFEHCLGLGVLERIAGWLSQAFAERPPATSSSTPPPAPWAEGLEGLVELGIGANERPVG